MKETLPTNQIDHHQPIAHELYPGTELHMALEKSRRDHWRETGECAGPTEIGRLQVDQDIIDYLAAHIDFGYESTEYPEQLSPDAADAQKVAGYEGVSFIADDTARALLLSIWQGFDEVVEADLARLPAEEKGDLHRKNLSYGRYDRQADKPHIDSGDTPYVRYAVTVAGPTTIFYTGVFPPSALDEDEELIEGTSVPSTAQATAVPRLSVVRFITDCDPHCSPETPADTDNFRIFLDTTIRVSAQA